jgi:hypothetical protein
VVLYVLLELWWLPALRQPVENGLIKTCIQEPDSNPVFGKAVELFKSIFASSSALPDSKLSVAAKHYVQSQA